MMVSNSAPVILRWWINCFDLDTTCLLFCLWTEDKHTRGKFLHMLKCKQALGFWNKWQRSNKKKRKLSSLKLRLRTLNKLCFPTGKSIVLDYKLLHDIEVVKWAKMAVCNNVQVLMHIIVAEFRCDGDYGCRSKQLTN